MKITHYTLAAILGAAISASTLGSASAVATADEASYKMTTQLINAKGLSDARNAGKPAMTSKPGDEVFTIIAASSNLRKRSRETAPRRARTNKRAIQTSQRRQQLIQRRQGQKSEETFDNFVGFYEIVDTDTGF